MKQIKSKQLILMKLIFQRNIKYFETTFLRLDKIF